MEEFAYDREKIISTAQERLEGLPATPLLVFNTSIIHRFIKLSDAFCLLVEEGNVESAQQLLRLMLDCIMKLFAVNAIEDPNTLCEKVIFGRCQFSDVPVTALLKTKVPVTRLYDSDILSLMKESGWFPGIGEFYGKLSSLIHASYYHAIHLIAENPKEFRIGGNGASSFEALLRDAVEDFNRIQSTFIRLLATT